MKILNIILGIVSILMIGCEKKIDVEVFIATKGGENIKLGIVNVKAIPLDLCKSELKDFSKIRASNNEKYNAEMNKSIAPNQEESSKINQEIKTIEKEISGIKQNIDNQKKIGNDILLEYSKSIKSSIIELEETSAAQRAAREKIIADKQTATAKEIEAGSFGTVMDQLSEDIKKGDPTKAYESLFNNLQKSVDINESNTLEGVNFNKLQTNDISEDVFYTSYNENGSTGCDPNKVIKILGSEEWQKYPKLRNSIMESANKLKESSKRSSELIVQLKESENKLTELKREEYQAHSAIMHWRELFGKLIEENEHPLSLYKLLPKEYISSETNADGKCQLELPTYKKWVIAAQAQRLVGEKTENYFWVLELSADNIKRQNIILSNNNLLECGISPSFLND
jgi:hypothetical protein